MKNGKKWGGGYDFFLGGGGGPKQKSGKMGGSETKIENFEKNSDRFFYFKVRPLREKKDLHMVSGCTLFYFGENLTRIIMPE